MWFWERKKRVREALYEAEQEAWWQKSVNEALTEAADIDAILFYEHQATEAMDFMSPLVDSRTLPTTATVPRSL